MRKPEDNTKVGKGQPVIPYHKWESGGLCEQIEPMYNLLNISV